MEKVTREDVVHAYKIYLGRMPESEECFLGRVGVIEKNSLKNQFLQSKEHSLKAEESMIDFVVIGNCHAIPYKNIIETVTNLKGVAYSSGKLEAFFSGDDFISHKLTNAKFIIFINYQNNIINEFNEVFGVSDKKVKFLPAFLIKSFHPDLVYVQKKSGGLVSEEVPYNSRICLFSYLNDIDQSDVVKFFSEEIFRHLGYLDLLENDRHMIARVSKATSLPISDIFECFIKNKIPFMHSVNHPKIEFLKEVTFKFLEKENIFFNRAKADYLEDPLKDMATFPIYKEVAENLGFNSEYYFKLQILLQSKYGKKGNTLSEFIEYQYNIFSKINKEEINLDDYENQLFEKFKKIITSCKLNSKKYLQNNPYENLPDYQFWRRSISNISIENVDPVASPKFIIDKDNKVATAGSCFAQHISRTLIKSGFNFFVTEKSDAPDAFSNNYGVYSARYGNIYSTRQLLQLFYRVYGYFKPVDDAWELEGGRLVDPFRPQIQPGGFACLDDLLKSREQHFYAVREMFENMDIFVFTLGLTEIWCSKIDGAVFPLAPGVAGGMMDNSKYEFINLDVEEVRRDLQIFISMLSTVNPKVRILLTVSPVPLMATYENRHVLCSTTLSKSILRVAADVIAKENSNVDYFPSYEIIVGNYNRGSFFEDDLRSVKPEGVAQVMSTFMKNYTEDKISEKKLSEQKEKEKHNELIKKDYAKNSKIICDEELLDR